MGSVTKNSVKIRIKNFSIFPRNLLYRIILGKIKDSSGHFIVERDYTNVRMVGNLTPIIFTISTILVYFVSQYSILLALLIGTITSLGFLIVFGDHIRAKIINRHQEFEEMAFLIINSLSINMQSTESFPHSIELLLSGNISDDYYMKYFQEIIYRLNLGENEDELIQEEGKIFRSTKYQNAFQNIKVENTFIESDPDFLLRVRKKIKLIEDNIVIFIAVSCLLPLVLTGGLR